MYNPFHLKTGLKKTIGDIVLRPIKEAGMDLNAVDVGARNGLFLLPQAYSQLCHLTGFEPNPEEHRKLLEKNTDAMKTGLAMPHFKSEKYHDCALWNADGTRPLYVTVGPGATTLMGKTNSKMMNRLWLEGGRDSYENEHSKVEKVVSVNCRRLDSVIDAKTKIDFLKVDVEGADLAVLQGAEALLKLHNILFIRTECQFLSYYDKHPLFGDQQEFLKKFGFRLVGLDLNHLPYTRDQSRIPAEADRRLIYAGDAYFMLDPDVVNLSAMDLQRAALICFVFRFNSLAVSLLRDAALLSQEEIDAVEDALAKTWTKRRLLNFWEKFPYKARDFLRNIKVKI